MSKEEKAREYNSPKLQELLDDITPLEMEQTKIKMMLYGWICPVCGAGNSPDVSTCPCTFAQPPTLRTIGK